ncbi:hotdog fold thioesterase [Rhodobacterales bacterium HKCCE3408]|nr:hotdog fold thioesterase [Rhodobacterales bacterium HKCCE3408]
MRPDLQENFARQGIMATFGATLEEASGGRVVISAPITPAVSQQQGFAHAGLTFALGDSAQGYAALTAMAEGADVLTVEMKINLIAPAAGRLLRAYGEVVKPGRRLVVTRGRVEAEAEDGTRRDIAILQGTMIPV